MPIAAAVRCWLVVTLALAWGRFLGAEEPDFSQELPRIAPTEPSEALGTFAVQPNYRLELAAAEPLVASPVAVAWDERGRMFVVEMRGYSEHREEGISRIRLLLDDNNDGTYDRSLIFAEKLLWPTAIACWDGGVFIADAPDILYLKDTNNDGTADVRRRVFTGFGTQNVQGLLNSFHWTFDNRIHGSASSNGGEITVIDRPDQKPVSVRGRDFSFDPRTLDFRAESGGAQHGMTFDDYGRKFVSSNSDHVQQVMYDDRYVARNPLFAAPSARVSIAVDGPQAEVFRISPVEPWRIVRTRLRVSGAVPGAVEGGGRAAGYFTGATGVTAVRGSAFKNDELGSMLVVGDVGSNLVHRKKLTLHGVQYAAERVDEGSELVASRDNWFRPAQYANGPDGALYIMDVYREVIEHPHSIPPIIKKHLDLDSGRDRGRIYRLAPKSWQRSPVERLDQLASPQLIALLAHENAWHRETAARLLCERADPTTVAPLRKLAHSTNTPPLGRIHALYALAGLAQLDEAVLLSALAADPPGVREHAVRLAETLVKQSPALTEKLLSLLDDENAHVRYQLAFTLGELPELSRAGALVHLLCAHPGDRWLQTACLSSLQEGAGTALVALLSEEAVADQEGSLPLAKMLAAQTASLPAQPLETTLGTLLASDVARRHAAFPVALHAIAKQLKSQGKPLPTPQMQATVEELLAARRVVARQRVLDTGASAAERVESLEFLSLAPLAEVQDALAAGLSPQSPREVQLAALRTLSDYHDAVVGRLIVEAWGTFTPEMRRAALTALTSRPERMEQLLSAVADKQIAPSEIEPAQIALLRKHPNANLRSQAEKLFQPPANRADLVQQYRPALDQRGDAARGKQVFAKICAACHRAEGVGHELGPNLAAMKNRGPEAVLVNVLDPNREVNPQFLSYLVVTGDGRTLTGMIAAESANGITLKRADGQGDEVLRSEIEELHSTGLSLMPEGMERQIDLATMSDVIAYVMSLK
jgi:putative membrane-bound dehydrogenase-like protein